MLRHGNDNDDESV